MDIYICVCVYKKNKSHTQQPSTVMEAYGPAGSVPGEETTSGHFFHDSVGLRISGQEDQQTPWEEEDIEKTSAETHVSVHQGLCWGLVSTISYCVANYLKVHA